MRKRTVRRLNSTAAGDVLYGTPIAKFPLRLGFRSERPLLKKIVRQYVTANFWLLSTVERTLPSMPVIQQNGKLGPFNLAKEKAHVAAKCLIAQVPFLKKKMRPCHLQSPVVSSVFKKHIGPRAIFFNSKINLFCFLHPPPPLNPGSCLANFP
jgi:hypothetical protein